MLQTSRIICEAIEQFGFRPAGYTEQIIAIAERVEGDAIFLTEASNADFHGIRGIGASERHGCNGCGGESLVNLASDPAAMEAALAD
jgi:hypothetical protein